MNRLLSTISIIVLMVISCGQKERIVDVPVAVNCPPTSPRGVYAVNLDGKVEICWVANYENDIEGYNVYRGTTSDGDFFLIGTVPVETSNPAEYCYDDLDTANGVHFYYAVSAYDRRGAESDLIIEEVASGTPRPEGVITLYDAATLPNQSGYDFYPGLSNTPQAYDAPTTDIFFGVSGGTPTIFARRPGAVEDSVMIQDYGYTDNFDVIALAPAAGWAPSRSAEAIVKHTYILRLIEADGFHYAKVFVTAVTGSFVTFDWAFQTDPGNPDLAPPAPGRGTGNPRQAQPGLKTVATLLTNRFSDPPIVEKGNMDTGL